MSDDEKKIRQPIKHKKHVLLLLFILVATLGAILWLVLWFFHFRNERSTEDAYVHGNMIAVNSQISGNIAEIYVKETDHVNQDQLLIKLDETDRKIAFEKSVAYLADCIRKVLAQYETARSLHAKLQKSLASLMRAKEDFNHRKKLLISKAVSLEDYQHALASYKEAKETVKYLKHRLNHILAMVENTSIITHPMVVSARKRMEESYIQLKRCRILAPQNGIIAHKKGQVGESISPEDDLMMIIPLAQIWINANFKETDLQKIRIGQSVTAVADMYGSKVQYSGKVVGINPGTGNVFSILPPQNATGNWIKIVQRLPVRIQLDPKEVQKNPLWLGLSMRVTIHIRGQYETIVAQAENLSKPMYQTDMFKNQLEGVESQFLEILAQNLPAGCSPEERFSLLTNSCFFSVDDKKQSGN